MYLYLDFRITCRVNHQKQVGSLQYLEDGCPARGWVARLFIHHGLKQRTRVIGKLQQGDPNCTLSLGRDSWFNCVCVCIYSYIYIYDMIYIYIWYDMWYTPASSCFQNQRLQWLFYMFSVGVSQGILTKPREVSCGELVMFCTRIPLDSSGFRSILVLAWPC